MRAEFVFAQLTQAFEASQKFARPEVMRRQMALLERIARHADTHVPFYRDSKRLKALFRANGDFTFAGWPDVAILTRAEAQEHQEALQAQTTPPEMGALDSQLTSGSTGIPLRFTRTQLQAIASEVHLNRTLRWHGVWPIERVAVADKVIAEGPQRAEMLRLSSADSPAENIAAMRRSRTTHVIAKPGLAEGWADTAGPEDLKHLRAIVTTGETLRPEVRAKIERRLNAKVIDFYSTNELGPVASEGPDQRLRIHEETVFLEEPTPGDGGVEPIRAIATPLYAFGMPLIRYAPGDFVRFSRRISRETPGLRILGSIIGRQRNLFLNPDGSRFLPGFITATGLEKILAVRGWQLVQTSLRDIEMRLVVPTPPTEAQWAALLAHVKNCLPRHNTSAVIVERIENDMQSGKAYEMFRCLVSEEN